MSSEIKNVILVGASGNLGDPVLKVFLNSSFNVTVLSRKESSATFPSNVKVIKADYSSTESVTDAFKGQDAVISLVGNQGFPEQSKFIDAAIAAGVKRFLPSEFGSNTQDERVRAIVPIFKGKVATVDYLKSKEDKISWTAVVTGPFFDWGLRSGFLGFNFSKKSVQLIDNGKGVFSSTNLQQIGNALVAILQKPAETKNHYVYVSSFDISQEELLSAIEKSTGSKWTVDHVKSKDLIAQGTEKLQKHDYSGIVALIQGAAFGDANLGDSRPAGLWNDKLGLKKESLDDSLKAVINGKLVGE